MAEEENNTEQAIPTGEGTPPTGPQFAMQRIYLKDSSFESPRAPKVFQSQWQPKINFDIKTRSNKVQDDVYEVVLSLTAEAQLEDEVAFLAEVHQAGIFTMKDFEEEQLEQIIGVVCPNILFPYGREAIDALIVKGSFPALMLSPINFEALYQQKKQQEAEQGTAAEAPAPDAVQ